MVQINAREFELIYNHSWKGLTAAMQAHVMNSVPCKEWKQVSEKIQKEIWGDELCHISV